MKKSVFLVAILAIIPFMAYAQQKKFKPDTLKVATEVFFSPISFSIGYDNLTGDPTIDGSSISIPSYGAKVRVFTGGHWAFRMQLGLNSDIYNDVSQTTSGSSTYKTRSSESYTTFSLVPGFEYHFKGTERVSPYVGAEVGLLLNANNTAMKTDGQSDSDSEVNAGFVLNAVTGFDVYLCKGLYLGAELGFGITSSRVSSYDSGNTKNHSGLTSVGFTATPAIRVGWLF